MSPTSSDSARGLDRTEPTTPDPEDPRKPDDPTRPAPQDLVVRRSQGLA